MSDTSDQDKGAGELPPRLRHFGRKSAKGLRKGRQALVKNLLPELQIELEGLAPDALDPFALFDDPVREVWLEVGFGGGEHLLAQAEAHPHVGFIGCEPFMDGVAKLLTGIEEKGLKNVRVMSDDARKLLDCLQEESISRAFLLFPDPWPKKKHNKRRFVNRETILLMARAMRDDGEWRIASDIMDYIDWSLRQLTGEASPFRWTARSPAQWRRRSEDWPATRYEQKAKRQGRVPAFLKFRRLRRQKAA